MHRKVVPEVVSTKTDGSRFDRCASVYEKISTIYSGGQINKTKVAALDDIVKPGKSVMFAGVGGGDDFKHAATLGANVTAMDLSQGMIDEVKRRTEGDPAFDNVKFVCADLMHLDPKTHQYDVTVANFFFNVFYGDALNAIVDHMVRMTKPGGYIAVGDFAVPSSNKRVFGKAFNNMHQLTAYTFFTIFTNTSIHKCHDIPKMLEARGMSITKIQYFKYAGAKCYWSITAQKPDNSN